MVKPLASQAKVYGSNPYWGTINKTNRRKANIHLEIEWFVDSIANDVKYSVKLLIKLMIIAIISLSIPSFVGGVDGDYVRGIVWVVGRVDDGNRLLIYRSICSLGGSNPLTRTPQ